MSVPQKYAELYQEMENIDNIIKLQEKMTYKPRWQTVVDTIPPYAQLVQDLVEDPAVIQEHAAWHLHLGPLKSVVERTLLCMDMVLGSDLTAKMLQEFDTDAVAACMGFVGARFSSDGTYTPTRTMLSNAISYLANNNYPMAPMAGVAMVYSRLKLGYETVQYLDHSTRSLTHTAPRAILH